MKIELKNKTLGCISKIIHGTKFDNKVYVVGGFVRDLLMGNEPSDIDLLVDGDINAGIDFAEWFCKKNNSYEKDVNPIVYGLYGTAKFQFMGEKIECVAPRSEKYREDSRNPNVASCGIINDCLRRDFTINSMFINISTDELLDYSGYGISDLQKGVIRCVGNPEDRYSEDPLRMLRTIRFSSRFGFKIDGATFSAICKMHERIRIITKERILDELNKMILSKNPDTAFELLFESGLLEIIFPALYKTRGRECKNGKYHKDVFAHSLKVLKNLSEVSDKLYLRWAALLHDIGKPKVKEFKDGNWTFENHAEVGSKMIDSIFKQMGFPLDDRMDYVKKLIRLHMRPMQLCESGVTDAAIRRILFDAGDDIDDLLILCNADITSSHRDKIEKFQKNYEFLKKRMVELEESDRLRNFQPPVDGNEIMGLFGLAPCKMVGILKEKVKDAILDGIIPNEHDAAKQYVIEEFNKLKKQKL